MSDTRSLLISVKPVGKILLRVLWPACFLVVGCVNLEDVAQLTKLADQAQQKLPAVVADIPASCERQNQFIQDLPGSELPKNMQLQDCKSYHQLAEHLSKDQSVLIAYFDALGKLASNTPLAFGKTIDTDVSTIEKLPNLSKDTVHASTAAQQIAKILADAVTNSYRSGKINSIVLQSDEAVQELAGDLKTVIVDDYGQILSNEQEEIRAYYKGPLDAKSQSERLAFILVTRQLNDDTAALEKRQAAAMDYGKVMDSLASLHAKLRAEAAQKANLKQIAKDLGPYISDCKDAISKLRG